MAETEQLSETSWRQLIAGRKQFGTLSSNGGVAKHCGFVDHQVDPKKGKRQLKIYLEQDKNVTFTDSFTITSGLEISLPKPIQNSLLNAIRRIPDPYIIVEVLDINESNLQTEEDYRNKLEREVAASLSDPKNRKKRLKDAPELPETFSVTTTVYKRNPDVIAEALDRAKGKCEQCKKPAPFKRASNKSPYLEVHHWLTTIILAG
jgi:hypothetical protein